MLAIVGLGLIGEDTIRLHQLTSHLTIHRDIPQGSGVEIDLAIHRGTIEPLVVTGSEEEDALVRLPGIELDIGRSGHIAGEVIAGMGHDECCHAIVFPIIDVAGQQTVNLLTQQLGIGLIESSCLCGWSGV